MDPLTIVTPNAVLGGAFWDFVSPELAFTLATVVGLLGTGYFLVYSREFETHV